MKHIELVMHQPMWGEKILFSNRHITPGLFRQVCLAYQKWKESDSAPVYVPFSQCSTVNCFSPFKLLYI